jgi:hypothetical protein
MRPTPVACIAVVIAVAFLIVHDLAMVRMMLAMGAMRDDGGADDGAITGGGVAPVA